MNILYIYNISIKKLYSITKKQFLLKFLTKKKTIFKLLPY